MRNTDTTRPNKRKGQATRFSILNGNNVLGNENTTNESWQRFLDARAKYYRKVDQLIAEGKPNDPLLGHPKP